jgi:pimeloyl-ACP methyl ester carboxylesterase
MSQVNVDRLRDFGSRPATNYPSKEELIRRYRLEPAGTMVAAPEVIRYIAAHSGKEQPDGTWRHKFDRSLYSIFERLDAMPYWDRIRVPALLVAGEQSGRIGPEICDEIRSRSPDVQLAAVRDSNHHITLDNPAGFVQALTPFLALRPTSGQA